MPIHILNFITAIWFLPLFPLSGPFVYLLGRKIRSTPLRACLFIASPVIGVTLLGHTSAVPDWLDIWVSLSALLYAFRLLSTRDLRLWTTYLGASSYALLWLLAPATSGWMAALALGIPLALMTVLTGAIEKRFGAAYIGLFGKLHFYQPYLAGTLTLVTLALVATPIFPGFLVLTGIVFHSNLLVATTVMLVWVMWTWAAVLLLQGFMQGRSQAYFTPPDLSPQSLYGYATVMTLLVIVGLVFSTHLLQ